MNISLQTIEESITHAIVKARGDVNAVVQTSGYTPVTLGSTSPIGIWRVIMRHYDILSLHRKIRKGDTVFLQFPWIHSDKRKFYDALFGSGGKVDCLIHDIDGLRNNAIDENEEIRQLLRCHRIIAHTPAMKEILVEKGADADRVSVLNLFPYLTDDPVKQLSPIGKTTIIFAGNLSKSGFVNKLHLIASEKMAFNLYGKGIEGFAETAYVGYKGIFSPDHPGVIEGNWGLVWDGNSLHTCDGALGDYLCINSSHKTSLYLSLGIPVIMWGQSSLGKFVEAQGAGVTVDSLEDLESKLDALGELRICQIQQNARRLAKDVRSGAFLKEIIKSWQ